MARQWLAEGVQVYDDGFDELFIEGVQLVESHTGPLPPLGLIRLLVSYWKLDEASGNALDAHGTNPLTQTGSVGTAAGKISTARDFPGGANYFLHGDNTDLSVGDIDFTFSLWFKAPSYGSYPVLLCKGPVSTWEYVLYYNSASPGIHWQVVDPSGTNYSVDSAGTSPIPAGSWHHVIVWHDSGNNQLGIQTDDGTVVFSSSFSTGVRDAAGDFHIGADPSQSLYWTGQIDEVGFWKRVLTPAERTALYGGGAGLPYPFEPAGAMAGTAALVFGHGASVLSGAVVLTGTAALLFGHGTSVLRGTSALAGSSALVFGHGTSVLQGAGVLAGASALLFTPAGTPTEPPGPIQGTCTITFGHGFSTLTNVGAICGETRLSMASNWRLLANPVSVTYVRKASKTAYDVPVDVSCCQIRMLTQTHVEGDMLLRTATLVANVWAERLIAAGVATSPKPQDVLVIGGDRYTITAVDHAARAAVAGGTKEGLPQRYRCALLREG